ncbi:ArsR/SmtB family transcription factor [Flavihumibacter petaseus]|uniref:Putative ArsR family transcriptional regulator n=1 Tax=Flavihumibacter petaseus NBRC 106054 TaxID=1220578 RepID=A0A0E9N3S3_9BACT|nr:metalloregulator ArsR/SmtB family transcription factor [Flavihumibacter petaseus]GAO44010.1 putative ArsR family transcriptional regulator [Flavihumibacter petaseus NBRC 106054]
MPIPDLDVFQVIADPSRRQILHLLTKGSQNINGLSENFDMSRPAVSKHIKILETAGFVTIRESGRERFCELNHQGFDDLKKWISYFDRFWNNKLNNLENVMNKKRKAN